MPKFLEVTDKAAAREAIEAVATNGGILVNPVIGDPDSPDGGVQSFVKDTSGNNMLMLGKPSTNAVNHLQINNGGTVYLGSRGNDANISLELGVKGTGAHLFSNTVDGQKVTLQAAGTGANKNIDIRSQGSGTVQANGSVITTAATAMTTVTVLTGSESRPSTTGAVLWIGGTTQPTNMAIGDLWFDQEGSVNRLGWGNVCPLWGSALYWDPAGPMNAGYTAEVHDLYQTVMLTPFIAGRTTSITRMAFPIVSNAAAGTVVRMGIYELDTMSTSSPTVTLIADAGTAALDTGAPTGVVKTFDAPVVAGKTYFTAVCTQVTSGGVETRVRTMWGWTPLVDPGTFWANKLGYALTGTVSGALPGTGTLTSGGYPSPAVLIAA